LGVAGGDAAIEGAFEEGLRHKRFDRDDRAGCDLGGACEAQGEQGCVSENPLPPSPVKARA